MPLPTNTHPSTRASRAQRLERAVRNNDPVVAAEALSDGTQVNQRNSNQNPLLGLAALLGHTAVMETLIAHGADPNACNGVGDTNLIAAVMAGQHAAARLLLDAGADVNMFDQNGTYNPLFLAVNKGDREAIRLLLEAGANLEAASSDGETVLFWAARHSQPDMVDLLLQHGANWRHPNKHGRTAEWCAQWEWDMANELHPGHRETTDRCAALLRAVREQAELVEQASPASQEHRPSVRRM